MDTKCNVEFQIRFWNRKSVLIEKPTISKYSLNLVICNVLMFVSQTGQKYHAVWDVNTEESWENVVWLLSVLYNFSVRLKLFQKKKYIKKK